MLPATFKHSLTHLHSKSKSESADSDAETSSLRDQQLDFLSDILRTQDILTHKWLWVSHERFNQKKCCRTLTCVINLPFFIKQNKLFFTSIISSNSTIRGSNISLKSLPPVSNQGGAAPPPPPPPPPPQSLPASSPSLSRPSTIKKAPESQPENKVWQT